MLSYTAAARSSRGYITRQSQAAAVDAISHRTFSNTITTMAEPKYNEIIVIGGGIAGLSTARYLLAQGNDIRVTIIDKNQPLPEQASYETYDKQQMDLLHYNIPSRRNGNVLCPSLTVPWTTRSLWKEAFLPLIKSYWGRGEKSGIPATISFDTPSLLWNRDMVSTLSNASLITKYVMMNCSSSSPLAVVIWVPFSNAKVHTRKPKASMQQINP